MIRDKLREQQISPRNEYNFSKASPSGVPRSTKGSASFSSSSTGGASLGGSPTQSRWLGPGSLEDTVLIRALVHWQRSGSGLATKKQDFSSWPCLPPSLGHRFGAGPGPGARAGGPGPSPGGPSPPGRGLSSVVWSTASFPLKNPPTLFWLHYSAYFSYTYRRYLDRWIGLRQ